MREGFLAKPFGIAQAAQVPAEALAYVHAWLEARLSPINLQTMRDNLVDCAGVSSMVPSPIVDRNASMAQHFTSMTAVAGEPRTDETWA